MHGMWTILVARTGGGPRPDGVSRGRRRMRTRRCGAAAAEVATPAIEIGRENVVTVATGDISVGPLISGELRAQREATVRAELGGSVLSVSAEEGATDQAGGAAGAHRQPHPAGRLPVRAVDGALGGGSAGARRTGAGAHRTPGQGWRARRARSRVGDEHRDAAFAPNATMRRRARVSAQQVARRRDRACADCGSGRQRSASTPATW